MIHLATIHYLDPSWIDVQLRQLQRHTSEPYRVYAVLDGIDREHFSRFHHAEERWDAAAGRWERVWTKLNHLGAVILEQAGDDDLMVFMHGDAFPIADWVAPVRAMLAARPLAAVRRDENCGEPIPHPCFTATTPRFWRELGGDWSRGPEWRDSNGEPVTDVGAVLWRELNRRGIAWHPILRSNARDLHPVWFAVYGDLIYHHGAAFRRRKMSRADAGAPASGGPVERVRRSLDYRLRARRNDRLSAEMYRRVVTDEDFHRQLIGR